MVKFSKLLRRQEAKKETLWKLMRYLEAKTIARGRSMHEEGTGRSRYQTIMPPWKERTEDAAASYSSSSAGAVSQSRASDATSMFTITATALSSTIITTTTTTTTTTTRTFSSKPVDCEIDDKNTPSFNRRRVRAPSAAAIDAAANSPSKTRPSQGDKFRRDFKTGGGRKAAQQRRLLTARVEGIVGERFYDSSDDEEYEVTRLGTDAQGELRPETIVFRTQKPHSNLEKRTWDMDYVISKLALKSLGRNKRGQQAETTGISKKHRSAAIVEKFSEELQVTKTSPMDSMKAPQPALDPFGRCGVGTQNFHSNDSSSLASMSTVAPPTTATCRQALSPSPVYDRTIGYATSVTTNAGVGEAIKTKAGREPSYSIAYSPDSYRIVSAHATTFGLDK